MIHSVWGLNEPTRGHTRNGGEMKKGSGHSLSDVARPGTIITFALVQGIVIIAAIFAYMVFSGEPAPPNDAPEPIPSYVMPAIGLLASAGACAGAIVLPGLFRRNSEAEFKSSGEQVVLPIRADQPLSDAQAKLAAGNQAAALVGQALLEGAAVINLVLFLLDEHWIHFGFAAISVIGILLLAPTAGKVKQAIEDAAS